MGESRWGLPLCPVVFVFEVLWVHPEFSILRTKENWAGVDWKGPCDLSQTTLAHFCLSFIFSTVGHKCLPWFSQRDFNECQRRYGFEKCFSSSVMPCGSQRILLLLLLLLILHGIYYTNWSLIQVHCVAERFWRSLFQPVFTEPCPILGCLHTKINIHRWLNHTHIWCIHYIYIYMNYTHMNYIYTCTYMNHIHIYVTHELHICMSIWFSPFWEHLSSVSNFQIPDLYPRRHLYTFHVAI